jgi:hypothetical protein
MCITSCFFAFAFEFSVKISCSRKPTKSNNANLKNKKSKFFKGMIVNLDKNMHFKNL